MKDLRSGIEHLKQAKAHMSKANGIMSDHISKLKALEEENAEACDAMWSYQAAIEEGMKPEDARYLLPETTKTSLVMTINARSLQNFLTLRLDSHVQWEIRKLALEIERELMDWGKQWSELMVLLMGVRK